MAEGLTNLMLFEEPFQDHMSEHNPYTAPTAKSNETPSERSKTPLFILCGLVLLQMLDTLRYSWPYFELVRTGSVSIIAVVLGASGDFCLYLATILALIKSRRSATFFLVGAICLGAATPFFGWKYGWGQVIISGAVFGAAGWIMALRNNKAKL